MVLRGLTPYLLLTLLAVLFFLPGIQSLPPTDRDEARYIQATRQMLETGDYTRIYFQDEPRHKKPIGVYWLQAASLNLFGSSELWVYRVPSVLAAWLSLLALFWIGSRLVGRKEALLGAVVLGTIGMLSVEARLAKSDAALLLCIIWTQGVLGLCYSNRLPDSRVKQFFLVASLWVSLAYGFLIKGPVAPGVFVLTTSALLLFDRDRSWILRTRPILGACAFLAVALPWFIAIESAAERSFVAQAWTEDILPKIVSGHESHWGPPGYYLLTSFLTFWPWSILSLIGAVWLWRNRQESSFFFLLCWLAPSWLALELMPTKLPHYTLPLYPALALACGSLLSNGERLRELFRGRVARTGAGLWILFTVLLVAALLTLSVLLESLSPFGQIGAVVLALMPIVFVWRCWERLSAQAVLKVFVPAAFAVPLFLSFGLPQLSNFWPSSLIAEHPAVRGMTPKGRIVISGYREPSVVFLTKTNTMLTTPERAAAFFSDYPETVAVVSEREQKVFEEKLRNDGFSCSPASTRRGFNYSKGKWITLAFYIRSRCSEQVHTARKGSVETGKNTSPPHS